MLLSNGNFLRARAGTADAVSCAIFGRNTSGYSSLTQPLGQTLLQLTTRTLYTADRDITIETILLTNTTPTPVMGVILYLNGTGPQWQVAGQFIIPPHTTFSYSNGEWHLDSEPSILTAVGTAQITVSADEPQNPQLNDLWLDIS
jgi:hypothetical protein